MQTQGKTRTLVSTALMAAVMAVLSPISIPIGPIPITLGVFAVYLTAALLPTLPALASLSVYVFLGAIGLPVFSSFQGGPQVLAGPTGGYIVGYFAIVLGVSLAAGKTEKYSRRMAAALASLVVFYLLGTLWYTVVTGASFASGLAACVLPFAIPDIVKAAAALALAAVLQQRMKGRVG